MLILCAFDNSVTPPASRPAAFSRWSSSCWSARHRCNFRSGPRRSLEQRPTWRTEPEERRWPPQGQLPTRQRSSPRPWKWSCRPFRCRWWSGKGRCLVRPQVAWLPGWQKAGRQKWMAGLRIRWLEAEWPWWAFEDAGPGPKQRRPQRDLHWQPEQPKMQKNGVN